MAKNIINLDNVRGYAQYGNDYSDVLEQKRKKKKLEAERENASLGEKILGTAADVSGNILQGGLNAFEGVSDWARYRYADVMDLFGADEAAEKARARARENDIESAVNSFKRITQGDLSGSKSDEEIYYNDFVNRNSIIDEDTKILGANARNVFQGIGNTLGYAAMTGYFGKASAGAAELGTSGKILKGASDLAPIYMSAAGGGQTEAYLEGATDAEASLYGTFSGLIEAGTESLFGGLGKAADKLGVSKALGLGKGALDDKLIGSLTKRFRSTLVKNLVDLGFRGAGEGVEEVLSDFFGAFAKKMTYLKKEDLGKLIKDPNYLESFMSGTLSSVLSQGGANVNATLRGQETTTGITKNENKVVEAVVEERTKGKDLTNKEIQNIRNEVREDLQNGYISTDTIEQVLGQDYDRSKDTYLQESYNEKARKQTSFNTDLNQYKNENQRKIVQKAIDSGILNDSKKTHNFVDLVSKIAADKGMDFDFTNNERIKESGFGVEGKTVNGYVNGNTIGLNIESNNALNKTVGHEITHVLEGSELYQALQDSLKSYIGEAQWNKRISELSETYKNVENADVTKELTADLVGENLFNNEDFVRSLSTKDRNLFQKIFDEIKYLVKIATAGSKEKRDLVKLQKVFQEAYRDSKTTREGTQYSIKESKQMLEKQFKELTGDSKLVADAKIGRYAFQQIQGNEVEAPYSKEAMDLYEKIENSRKTSSHLYHSTPADRIQSIVQNGLQVGSQQNQEGVSSTDKLYLSATEELADSFTPEGSVMLRISPNANLENLDNDLLGGEGSYTITNNIDPKYLQVKENGKWVNLLKSQYAKQDVKYSLTTDNQGRQLSEQQQEYFKDSKVRDENGRLMEVYHGTDEDFNEFKYGGGEHGDGYYFTEDYDYAEEYSGSREYNDEEGRIVSAYLDLKNPLAQDVDLNGESMQKFMKGIEEKWGLSEQEIKDCFKNYNMDWSSDLSSKVAEKMGYGIEDVESTVGFEIDDPEEFGLTDYNAYLGAYAWDNGLNQLARESGFDGIISRIYNADTEGYEYIAFNSNQIKNVDNTSPTSNPDIRYSLTVQEADTGTDNTGRELSKEQKEYFKDSKATDENGNLITVYHTTTDRTAPFYEFNPVGTDGYRFGDQVVNYYTDSKEMSGSYADQRYRMVDTKKIDGFQDAKEWLKDRTDLNDKIDIQEIYDSFGQPMYQVTSDNVPILNFTSLDELNKNLKSSLNSWIHYFKEGRNLQTEDLFGKNQYEGYANITNPYVVDADGEYWSSVRYDYDTEKVNSYKNLDQEIKDKLIKLQQESIDKFRQAEYEEDRLRETMKYHLTGRQQKLLDLFETYLPISDTDRETIASMHDLEGSLEELRKEFENPYNTLENYGATSLKEFSKEYNKVKENSLKYANNTSYFYEQAPKLLEGTGVPSNSDTWYIAGNDFNEDSILENFETKRTTNDIVKEVIASNKSGETNYDGVIIKNVVDYGGDAENHAPHDLYVTFNSNQFKAVDNLNPTDDADIRYQLGTNEIAPTQGWNVRGEDIRLQSAVQETIAPLQEQVQQLQSTIEDLRDNIAPITEQEADLLPTDENIEAPTRYNLTQEESRELDELEQLPFDMTDEQQERYDELRAKEANEPAGEDMTPIESLTDVRDMDEVARDRSANAYQYEHPEVKPYFQEEARVLLAEINEVIPGERFMIEGRDANNPTEWLGYKRQASEDVANLLDGYTLGTKYTKDQLRDGLRAIIEDHGAENKAVSKRLEFMLDDRLRNGYDTIEGYHIEPNADYLNMLREQSWDKYYEEAPWSDNVPAEIENDVITIEPTIRRDEIAPVRETRDITEMLEQQEFRQDTQKKQPKVQPKPRNAIQRAWDSVMSGWVNRNVLGDRLARQSKNQQIKYNYDAFNNYIAEAQYNINGNQTNYNFESVGDGLNKIFNDGEKLGIPKAVLNEFLIDQENCDRWKIGKGSQTPYEESARRLRDYAIQYPEIKKWAKRVWQFGANSLQNRVDAGLMTQDQADGLRKSHPHYVPFFAEQDNIDTAFNQINELKAGGLKRAKGGAGEVMPVYDALSKYVNAEKKAIRFNDTLKEIIHTLGETNNFGTDERTDSTDISKNLFTDNGNYYITAYEDGRQITAKVSKEFFKELSRETENRIKEIEDNMSLLVKPLQAMNEFNRNIHTSLSLSFPVKNAIKDFGSALFNSKHTMKMLKNYNLGTIRELIQGKSKDAQQFLAGYGSGLTMGEYGNDTINQKLKNNKFLRGIRNLNNYIELMPRFAEFKASRQAGENMQQALYNAREVTMNFSRGGTVAKAINRDGITFFNTSVQGFDKLLRNFSGENGAKGVALALTKVAMLGILPAVFNDLAFGGGSDDEDEDYKALPNYIKDNYYLIKKGDGEFIRIPKSQPLAVIGSAARRTMEAARGEENAFEGFTKNAVDQIGVNNPLQNNVFAPLIQAFGSENGTAWYGGDIVPSRLQDEDVRDQYDASVDKFSIWLGEKLGVSPYKINYVIDQYSGGVGDVALPLITDEAKNEGGILAPIKDQFVVNSTTDNKYVSQFYSTREKIPTGKRATDDDILQKKYLDSVSAEMAELYAERREVQADNSLSRQEKFEKAQEIKKEINKLAQEALENYKNVTVNGDYANVDGKEYQRDENGWKKVNDTTSEELSSMGLNSSEKDTYFKTKNDISNIKNQYKDSKDYAAKKSSIINEIRNSKLPDEAKIALYNDTYNDKMADKYTDVIDTDSYLDFKSQTFTADKDKDGKSISGSKKQKVFDYVNSMNIPFEQKVMLVKSEYPTYNEYNQEIINYLNNDPNIDYQTMVDILEDLGFKVNGDNISW